ncbi:MAG: hypothetical protein OEY43_06820 [Gammaproteobacteria bacterium]|nr:hypothetical protein [Gammaproteobacteria bacterium]
MDISKKRIIMIHGLASKPPESDIHRLWKKCLIENIRIDDKPLANLLDNNPQVFSSAYWANATPHHIEDDSTYVNKLNIQVDKVIDERRKIKQAFHVGLGEKVGSFFKDRGQDVVKLLTGALTIKDNVMKEFLQETCLYDEDQYVADKMRKPLEDALRSAWDDGCDVALLSHSMGTFIAYDVLWRFSHRNLPEYKKYRNKSVQLFTTMGSPLGDSTVRGLLFSRFHKNKGKREFPTNIQRWHNYACLGDVVSHYNDFDKAFFNDMRNVGILPKSPKHRAIDYSNLHNPFEVVSHAGNKSSEKRNPHKSYGYLVQPRLGTWVSDFLRGKLK